MAAAEIEASGETLPTASSPSPNKRKSGQESSPAKRARNGKANKDGVGKSPSKGAGASKTSTFNPVHTEEVEDDDEEPMDFGPMFKREPDMDGDDMDNTVV
jgi:hypothetical protein